MADNVVLDPGAGGATCRTDDVGGIQYQVVKLDVGGDGLTVPVVGALPISAAALPLPAGASTEASLAALNAKVTAVNTGAVVVSGSALPAGAATEATLGTVHGHVDAIDTKTPALGQGLMAASVPVAIASNQSAVPISAAALPLPTGAAAEATQGEVNAHVHSIDGKVTACNTGAVTVAGSALPAGAATEATLGTVHGHVDSIDGKITACNTGAVTVAASALPAGAATEAGNLATIAGAIAATHMQSDVLTLPARTHTWDTPGGYSAANLITGTGAAGDMKNLASLATAMGAEVNGQAGAREGALELKIRSAVAPAGNPYVEIWFLLDLSDALYEDATAGAPGVSPARPPNLIIPVRLVDTQQVISVGPVPLPNAKFKAFLRNVTGQAFTNTDNENILSYVTWPGKST